MDLHYSAILQLVAASYFSDSMNTTFLAGTVLVFAFLVLIGLWTFLLLHKRFLQPLKNIEATVELWLNENSDPELLHGSNSNTADLGANLNQLLLNFQRTINEYKKLIEHSDTGILVVNTDGVILFANTPAALLLNRRTESLLGSELGIPIVAGSKTEIEIYRSHGEQSVVELSAGKIEWKGTVAHLLAIHDITARHQAEETTRYQAIHDNLTGLPNRAHFHDSLTKAIQRAETLGQGISVLFIDVDRFKEVNDTLGHAAGDEYLRVIAKRLCSAVRSDDLVARMSGDEFTIILEGVNDRETIFNVAKKLHSAISAPLDVAAQTLTPIVTIGFSVYPDDANDASTLLMCADTAMYYAKADGRHRTQSYAKSQGQKASRRFWMEHGLQQAEANDEFQLFYQPQVTLPDGNPTDMEVLLRWQHPEKGLMSPADFIPLLEESEQIQSVGDWIFRQAAADLKHWHDNGLMPNRIWINVSARQLASPDLVSRIDELIEGCDLNPERFGIEMTESGLAGNIDHTHSVIANLQSRGFRIAMDDFGTGYSALTFLRRLPLDMVKIDRAFVHALNEDPAALKLVRAIISMAHALEMQVLAEGVETEAEADYLIAEGCQLAQGFWFARPMPRDELTQWWQSIKPILSN